MTLLPRRATAGVPSVVDWRWWVLALAALSTASWGQGLRVVPTFSATQTLTDNRDLTPSDRQGDLILQIGPGVNLSNRRGSLQGTLSYTANGVVYARESSLNTVQHVLNAAGLWRSLDGWASVSMGAHAGQQQVSAFGTPSSSDSLSKRNQTQTYSYSLGPALSGMVLGRVQARAGLTLSGSRAEGETAGDSDAVATDLGLSQRAGFWGWSLTAQRQISKNADESRRHTGRALASLNLFPDVDWQATLRAGRELQDVQTGEASSSTTWGYGATWRPGPRTSLQYDNDRRFFGRSHRLLFTHRMARTLWSVSDSRDFSSRGTVGRIEISLYELLWAQSTKTDPVERDLEVRALLQGQDPGQTVVVGGFLTSTATINRRQQVSVVYQGLRSTLTASWSRGVTSSASTTGNVSGDLADGAVVQSGFTLGLNHRLTPSDSLAVSLSLQSTDGNAGRSGTDLKSILATWTGRLGPNTHAAVSLRHTRSDGDSNPYTESAVTGSVRMQF